MKAFPRADGKFNSSKKDELGMDLRDYFAAKAMQALITNTKMMNNLMAENCYLMADAMIKAREK